MGRSRAFGFLSIALCLAACFCASGNGVTKQVAEAAVNEAKKDATTALVSAKLVLSAAEDVKLSAEQQKQKAETAKSGAEKAAQDNEEAKVFAQEAKSAAEEAVKLLADPVAKAEKVIKDVQSYKKSADSLVEKADAIVLNADGSPSTGYLALQKAASAISTEARQLHGKIVVSNGHVKTAEDELRAVKAEAEKAQVAKYRVDAIVAVASIEKIIGSVDTDIQNTEKKKNEVENTVEAVKQLSESAPQKSKDKIHSLYGETQGELKTASDAVKAANTAKGEMEKQKQQAGAVLKTIQKEEKEGKAKKELDKIQACVKLVQGEKETINNALTSADTAAKNAKKHKDASELALSGKKTKEKDDADSAITVSVPLLLASIAYAALH